MAYHGMIINWVTLVSTVTSYTYWVTLVSRSYRPDMRMKLLEFEIRLLKKKRYSNKYVEKKGRQAKNLPSACKCI